LNPLFVVGIKAIAGGGLVVAFALVSEVLKPKEFAGLFAAAPSVAIASMLISWLDKGPPSVAAGALGMVYGAIGMALYCFIGVHAVRRWHAKLGSVASAPIWFAATLLAYFVLLR
jgi:hypothetical protein